MKYILKKNTKALVLLAYIFFFVGILFGLLLENAIIFAGSLLLAISCFLIFWRCSKTKDWRVARITLERRNIKEDVKERLKTFSMGKGYRFSEDGNSGFLIKTKISLISWGELISVIIKQTDYSKHNVEILISSKSIFPLTLWDYGKNSRNIDKISSLLS